MRIIFCIFLLISFNSSRGQLSVKIDTLIDFNKKDSINLFKEVKIINKIVQSDLFWSSLEEFDFGCRNRRIYHSKRSRKALYPKLKKDKKEYTNEDIALLLRNGQDEIGEKNDQVINLKLKAKTYESSTSGIITHGSTNKNTLIITSNRATRINSEVKGIYACHLLHEYMHVLGFKHKYNSPSKNKTYCKGIDIPLGIQRIAMKVVSTL